MDELKKATSSKSLLEAISKIVTPDNEAAKKKDAEFATALHLANRKKMGLSESYGDTVQSAAPAQIGGDKWLDRDRFRDHNERATTAFERAEQCMNQKDEELAAGYKHVGKMHLDRADFHAKAAGMKKGK